jgi:hypothetical protein
MLAKVFLQKILVENPVLAGPFFMIVPVFFGIDGDVFYMRPYDLSSN